MTVTNLVALSLVLDAAGQENVFGLIEFPTKQSQMATNNADTQEVIPGETAW